MLHSKLTSSLLIYIIISYLTKCFSRLNEMVLWVGFAFGLLAI